MCVTWIDCYWSAKRLGGCHIWSQTTDFLHLPNPTTLLSVSPSGGEKKRTLSCVSARKADYYYSDTHSRLNVLWSSSASLTVQRPAVRDQSTLNHRRSAHLIAANEHRPTTALIHTWFLFLSMYICTQHARRTTQTPIGNHINRWSNLLIAMRARWIINFADSFGFNFVARTNCYAMLVCVFGWCVRVFWFVCARILLCKKHIIQLM